MRQCARVPVSVQPACGSRRGAWFLALVLLLPAACSSLSARSTANLALFDTYWEALAADYPFFASKHIDWDALGAQYRAAVIHAEHPAERYHLLAGMLSELRDPHVNLEVPPDNWREGGGVVMLTDAVGFELALTEGRMHVSAWPDGAAPTPPDHLTVAQAQLPEIVQIEGYPVVWPLVEVLLAGAPGSDAELRLRWSDGTLSRHVLQRPDRPKVIKGTIRWKGQPVTVEMVRSRPSLDDVAGVEARGRFAVLRIDTFNCSKVGVEREQFVARLDERLAEAERQDGLILDLRKNSGGDATITFAFGGRFLTDPLTAVLATEQISYLAGLLTYTAYGTLEWEPRPPRFTKPIVVLTSWRTGSAAEHLARALQRAAGAVVIGERTAGAEAMIEIVAGPDGSTLRFGKMRAMETSGRGLQDDGVIPDIAVRLTLDDVRRHGGHAAAHADWEERLLRRAEAVLTARVR